MMLLPNIKTFLKNIVFSWGFAAFVFSTAFFLFLSPSSAKADFEEIMEEDYERIEIIHRQIKENENDINLYAETTRVRDALIRLTETDDFSADTIMYYSKLVAELSVKYNMDPMLILAEVATESSFRAYVVSPVGAIGLMQLLPSTAKYISEKTGLPQISGRRALFDPRINLELGVAYLSYLVKLTGKVEHAIIAYNIGPTNLFNDIYRGYPLPMGYVDRVMGKYNEIKSFDNTDVFQ